MSDSNQVQGTYEQVHQVDSRLDAYFNPPAQPAAEAEKPQEPMPSSEQKPADVVSQSAPEPATQTVDEEREALSNSKNPERTKSYIEKLKRERDEALAKSQTQSLPTQTSEDYGSSVYDSLRPKVPVPQIPQPPIDMSQFNSLNPQQAQTIRQQFVDENGNVDINGLNQALFQANQQAQLAYQAVQREREARIRAEETREVREAHTQHPELDPLNKDKFNPNLFNLVKDRLTRNMVEGVNIPLSQVAAQIKQEIGYQAPVTQTPKQIEEQAVERYKQTQQARNQGPFESGRGEPRADGPTLDDLRQATRGRGPTADRALAERLKRLGI